MRAPVTFDLSVIITGDSGRVDGDADFVFYNQPDAPGVRLRGSVVTVERNLLRAGATRLTLVAGPTQHAISPGQLELSVGGRGLELRFTAPPSPGVRALLLAEVYRRSGEWRLRALGQGYADGLAGIARDYGVEVIEDSAPPAAPPPRAGLPAGATPHAVPFAAATRAADPYAANPRSAAQRAAAAGGTPISADVSEVIARTNAERARHGLRPLASDVRLSAVARAHSGDMLARGYFSHTGLDGRQPWDRTKDAGIDYRGIAENIAWGQRSAEEVVDGWMNSPGHRANILAPDFTHIGVGRVGDHWTQLFGLTW